jgi:hypothetical protein
VIEELDKHKTGTKDRQRNRARSALRLIGEASKAPGRVLTIKSTSPIITLEVPPRAKVDWHWLSILDRTKPDDCLIAEAVTYGNDAAIFSHDSGPRMTAHDLSIEAYEPLEDWHLPPEQSESDKKIALLERQLVAARSTKPELAIEIEGREARELTLYRPILPPLEPSEVEQLLNCYLEKYPRASPVAAHRYFAMAFDDCLTPDQVTEYHGDYDAFARRVEDFLQKLHKLSYYYVVPIVGVRTTNKGSVSATNFHVTLETSGGFSLLSSAKVIREMAPFPKPPDVPVPRRDQLFGLNRNLTRGAMIPAAPHPTEIVWIDKPAFRDSCGRYGCADFQPQRSDLRKTALWPEDGLPVTGVLTVTAGANDVPNIHESVEITIEEREERWDSPQVAESLPKFLQTGLRTLRAKQISNIGGKVRAKVRGSSKKGNEPSRE